MARRRILAKRQRPIHDDRLREDTPRLITSNERADNTNVNNTNEDKDGRFQFRFSGIGSIFAMKLASKNKSDIRVTLEPYL